MHIDKESLNFIEKQVAQDLAAGKVNKIVTRFPPEPNGYLHIGSAYAINISHSVARKFDGKFNLRFDDTNPNKEDMKYVEAIISDMKWLGVDYGSEAFFGSDYAQQIYEYAKELILNNKAYVCDLSPTEIREYRGTLTEPGKNSPYRERTVEENLDLFEQMKEGKFQEGEKVLRAKIDMASPNISLRDPVIYRIIYTEHYRTKDEWCIYPMYDFAHPLQDYIEGVTHSLCSNEFVNNRALYEWVLDNLNLDKPLPRQIEFGRFNITGVVTSKRYLRRLVEEGHVEGWDDPRLPTLMGLRRRGYTRESILAFLDEVGVPKNESTVDVGMLEHFLRQDLMDKAVTVMAVLDPLKVVITNKDEEIEYLPADNNPNNPELGERQLPFTREIYIEREDFSENPPKKFKRLVPGGEVRLKHGYFIRCNEVIKDESGKVVELRCTYDPATKSGSGFTGRKVKGTIHWVSAQEGVGCSVRLFEQLFDREPKQEEFVEALNPDSLTVNEVAVVEPAIKRFIGQGDCRFQFLRHGFFALDKELSGADKLVFNRSVSLKSSWNPAKAK